MALYQFSRTSNQLSINDYIDVSPNNYTVQADTLNNIVLIDSDAGDYKLQINLNKDTVEINGTPFVGNAAALKTELYASVFNAKAGGPKVYRALLTQSGTDAPLATVLENTGNYSEYVYIVEGSYALKISNDNIADKVSNPPNIIKRRNSDSFSLVSFNVSYSEGGDVADGTWLFISSSICSVESGALFFSNNDGIIGISVRTYFEILVYP